MRSHLAVGLCDRCVLNQAVHLDDLPGGDEAGKVSEGSAENSVPPLLPTFGDYELIQEIARGGMGIVYQARQRSLKRVVAVKLMLLGPRANPETIKRFKFEAMAAAALQHPNIVAIHEVGIEQGEPFIAMEYVHGPTLHQIIQEQPIDPFRAALYLKSVAEAIHHAHERGIVHRDLKPSNVLIDSNNQARVTDFGLAKRLEAFSDSELTRSGQVLGSPSYASPEQALGCADQAGPASDVYSLGAILYHLITGRAPFVGVSIAEILHQAREHDPVAPRVLNAQLPRDLETICLKCIEKDPARRFRTAREVAEELGRFLRQEPIHARPVGLAERVWRHVKRKPALACSLTLVGILFMWGGYNAWRISLTKELTERRELEEWDRLFHPASPVTELRLYSEDLAGHFGEVTDRTLDAERLWVGMYLENDQRHMIKDFAPLLRYLERRLVRSNRQVRLDLKVFNKRASLERALTSSDPKEQIHLGRIGELGLSGLLNANPSLLPLVQQKSGGKVSVVFASQQSGITNLAGLRGRSVAFGSPSSTASGFKLPQLLLEQGLKWKDLRAEYRSDSEQNVDLVLQGTFDAAVTRKDKFNAYEKSRLIVLAEFGTTRMPWVASPRLTSMLADSIRRAFVDLADPGILNRLPEGAAGGFEAIDAVAIQDIAKLHAQVKAHFHQSNPTQQSIPSQGLQ